MNEGGFLDQKNRANVAAYYWRVHRQGGSQFYLARNLQDLRNHTQRRWYREIETAVLIGREWIIQLAIARRGENVCMFHRRQAS